MDKSTCLTVFYIAVLFACIPVLKVECQCDDDDFEYNNVDMVEMDSNAAKWLLIFGESMSGEVGPKTGFENGSDCYFAARGGYDGEKVLLLSPCYTAPSSTNQTVALSFAYYLFGDNAGTLTVYLRPGCLGPADLPMEIGIVVDDPIVGSQMDDWVVTEREIPKIHLPPNSQFQIIFEATLKGELNNSIAVDSMIMENATIYTTKPTTVTTPVITTLMPVVNTTSTISSSITTSASTTTSLQTSVEITTSSTSQETTNASVVTLTTSTAQSTTSPSHTSTEPITDDDQSSPVVFTRGINDSIGGSAGPTTTEMNVTLNFCEANLVIEGLDNCTFIGLMFAIVPLGIVFIVWLVCCTFNRYCRKVERSDGHGYMGDAESSMGKDHFASNSSVGGGYGYNSSLTDNTFVNSTSPDSTVKRGSTPGVTATPENRHEMTTLLEENGEKPQTEDNLEKKKTSVTNDYDLPTQRNHVNSGDSNSLEPQGDAESVPKGDSEDHPYAVLDGPTPSAESEDHDKPDYEANIRRNPENGEGGDLPSSNHDGVEVCNDTEPQESTKEALYHVLEGPTPLSLPDSSSEKNSNKLPSGIDGINVGDEKDNNNKQFATYHVLEGPSPPSPPDSPRPPRNRSKKGIADDAYEKVEIDDSISSGRNTITSLAPSFRIGDANARADQSDIEPYADSHFGAHEDFGDDAYDLPDPQTPMLDESTHSSKNTDNEAAYETIGNANQGEGNESVDNVAYSPVDDPDIGVTVVDSDGNEDTAL